jgi:hypothetical protein
MHNHNIEYNFWLSLSEATPMIHQPSNAGRQNVLVVEDGLFHGSLGTNVCMSQTLLQYQSLVFTKLMKFVNVCTHALYSPILRQFIGSILQPCHFERKTHLDVVFVC